MSATYVIKHVVSKILSLIALAVLYALTPVIKLLAMVFHFAGGVLALMLVGIAAHFYFSIGYTPSELYCVIAAAVIFVMKYVLMFTADYLTIMRDTLKDIVLTPMYVKPPVKYTL